MVAQNVRFAHFLPRGLAEYSRPEPAVYTTAGPTGIRGREEPDIARVVAGHTSARQCAQNTSHRPRSSAAGRLQAAREMRYSHLAAPCLARAIAATLVRSRQPWSARARPHTGGAAP
eukprot:scaffold185001_cov32-Tisochrysis_lutea.AAC.2